MASKLRAVFGSKRRRDLLQYYELRQEIGRGASSVVFEAVNKASGEVVAVKTVSKTQIKQDMKKLHREVEIMSSLRHQNIIRLIDVFESPKEIHLVMDLVRGGELFDKIVQRGQYSEADAAVLVAQILSAVAYMHAHGVAHRDLKPENLLCAEDQELYIRIADFGLSKMCTSGEDMVTICGTPDYVAPEVLECKPYTMAVDMWSVGVITYTLLCGFTPFYGDTHRELFQRILSLDYDFPDPEWSAISADAKDFIRGLLVVESQRPTAAQALMHPWLTQNIQGRPLPSLESAQKNLASKGVRPGRHPGAPGMRRSGSSRVQGAASPPPPMSPPGAMMLSSTQAPAMLPPISSRTPPPIHQLQQSPQQQLPSPPPPPPLVIDIPPPPLPPSLPSGDSLASSARRLSM